MIHHTTVSLGVCVVIALANVDPSPSLPHPRKQTKQTMKETNQQRGEYGGSAALSMKAESENATYFQLFKI